MATSAIMIFLLVLPVTGQTVVVLSGKVSDQQGIGVANARVMVLLPVVGGGFGYGYGYGFDSGIVASAFTDGNGNYTTAVPAGTYEVRAIPPVGSGLQGYTLIKVSITTDTVRNFVLAAGPSSLRGVITLQGRTATFPPGLGHSIATVTLNPGGRATNPAADGTFEFTNVTPGTVTLTASAVGYLAAGLGNVRVASDVTIEVPGVQLRAGLVNNDNGVNIHDITATVASFGTFVANRLDTQGRVVDINGDGGVNIHDITAVVSNFGSTSPLPWP